jgi:class 3 adenylate cyclase
MAYIEGQTLAELAGPFKNRPPREAAALVRTLALALEEAHSLGIIHRDLKPANIMINQRGEPIIMDFGLARRINRGDERLTHHGMVLGTPAYMSPEQVNGDLAAMGPASDIYSLGVILYELLTGRRPYLGPTPAILAQIISQEPAAPSKHRADLDRRLEGICRKAMARDIAHRFASMKAMADALDAVLRDETPSPPPGSAAPPAIDARLAEEVLGLLRTWGWGMGLKKLRGKVQNTRDDRKRTALQFFLDWMGGAAETHARAVEQFHGTPQWPTLVGWALAGQASVALRQRDYPQVYQLVDQATSQGDSADKALQATLAHTRATAYCHQGQPERALAPLLDALALLGPDHFAAGRILDTLGMVYAGKANFRVARAFYEQAICYKQRFDDDAGLALSHGQLGRLHLDWGLLDEAEHHFQEDLRLAQRLLDVRGEAQMYNHLGQVALARGEREAAAGHKSAARRYWAEAAGWLEGSIRRSAERDQPSVTEAYARKDRALVALLEGNVADAEQQARAAEDLFQKTHFAEGVAQVSGVWGLIRRAQGRTDDSLRKLRSALSYFDDTGEHAQSARLQWEIARTLRAADTHLPLVTRALLDALSRSEACRRDVLVGAIEEELREVNQDAYLRHVYRRVRGYGIGEDSPSLRSGSSEMVTVLFLELHGFTEYGRGMDPEEVLMTLNHLMADLADVLERGKAKVATYFGDGFMTIFRETRHAERAVQGAVDLMAALQEFNRPREVLGLPLFQARISVNTGGVCLGNVGTYHKLDFTAVGTAVSLASRLLHWAEPGLPCISRATRESIGDGFVYQPDNPRIVLPTGLGPCEVWDVVGRAGTP